MAKSSPIQTNFTAGELSPRLDGRTDIAKYDNGCEILENFVVHPQGGATRRPGSKFILETANSAKQSRLLPFQFNTNQSYAVEMGDRTARIVSGDGLIAEPDETTLTTNDIPDVGHGVYTTFTRTGSPPGSVSQSCTDTYPIWSNDGHKVYFIKTFEEKNTSASTHTLAMTIKQYTCQTAYNLFSGVTLDCEKTWNFRDCFTSGISAGMRRFHCGVTFTQRLRPHIEGTRFIIWDGIPDAPIDTQSTSHHDFRVYAFDLTTAFDLSSTTGGDLESSSVYDVRYLAGSSATANRYPIPISGLAFQPIFDSSITDNTGQVDGTFTSTSSSDSTTSVRSVTNYQGGRLMYVAVSNIATAQGQPSNTSTTISRNDLIEIDLRFNQTGMALSTFDMTAEGFTKFPEFTAATKGNRVVDLSPIFGNTSQITGLQVRSVRDSHLVDASGDAINIKYPGQDLSSIAKHDVSSSSSFDAFTGHNGTTYVLYIAVREGHGASVTPPSQDKYINHIFALKADASDSTNHHSIDEQIPFLGGAVYNVYEHYPGGLLGVSVGRVQDLPGAFKPFVTFDGKKIWYSQGPVRGATDFSSDEFTVAQSRTFKTPYLMLGIEAATDLNSFRRVRSNIRRTSSFNNEDIFDANVLVSGFTHDYILMLDLITPNYPVEFVTPYASTQLDAVRFAQSADVLFLAHPDITPQQLVRYGAYHWAVEDVPFVRGPMQDVSLDGSTVTASARTGTVTLTSSVGLFVSTDINRLVKVHDGFAKITGYTNETTVTAVVQKNADGRSELMPSYTATTIAAFEGDPDNTGLSHNDRITDSAGKFIEQGFEEGMRISISGFSNAGANEASALIVSVTADTILLAPSDDLTAQSAGDSVTITALLEADENYRLGAFSETTGFPAQVGIYEQRLCFANTLTQPQTIFFSSAGLFTDFTPGIEATDSITYTLGSNEVNVIQYMVASRLLVIGTSGGEFVVSSGSNEDVLKPTNIQIRRQANYGSSGVEPVSVGSAVLFVQRANRKVRELVYNFDTDSYYAPDLTLLAEHITEGEIKEIVWQQEPDSVLWARLGDGSMCAMTYRREEEVIAWHRHTLGGSGVVESIVVTSSQGGDDLLYMIVKRTINGATKRYIEKLSSLQELSDVEDALFADSHLTYSGSSTSSLSGLAHLNGQVVSVLGNGIAQSNKTVSNGSITLDSAVTKACVGLPFSSTLKTMRMDSGGVEGTSQAKTKRIREVTTRFLNTVGAKIGPDVNNLKFVNFGQTTTAKTDLFTGDKTVEFHGDYETDGFIVVKQDQPLPMTILAIMPLLQTFDR